MRRCSVDGCDNKYVAKGFCAHHYAKMKNRGDPLAPSLETYPRGQKCRVESCYKPSRGKGFCAAHYHRYLRYGDPLLGKPMNGEVRLWLDERASYNSDACLTFPFCRNENGYGGVNVDGRWISAHIYMCCTLVNGPKESDDLVVRHLCGKGHEGCVSPRHLSWGTASQNRMDMVEHGTARRGSNCNFSALNEDQVREIRKMLGKYLQREIGAMFGVGQAAISSIACKRTWAWLD